MKDKELEWSLASYLASNLWESSWELEKESSLGNRKVWKLVLMLESWMVQM